MGENPGAFLINVARQLPPTNDGGFCRRAANFWVALWMDRVQRNTKQDISNIRDAKSVRKVRDHKFVLSELYSKTGKLQKCAVTKSNGKQHVVYLFNDELVSDSQSSFSVGCST
eukprot:6684512-Pyramimonas_sp.AAC.2